MSVIAVEADKESFKDSLPGNAGRFSVSKLFGTVLASRSGELVDTTGSLSSAGVIGINTVSNPLAKITNNKRPLLFVTPHILKYTCLHAHSKILVCM